MKSLIIPLSIMCGSALVAGAIFFKDYGVQTTQVPAALPSAAAAPTVLSDVVAARADNRHLYGSVEAPVTIVEFSDLECPFCARLHPTLKRIVDESNGQVNWEYRHLPLANHPNSRAAAIASECVTKLVGAEAFWPFVDALFANIGKANAAFIKAQATTLGVLPAAYESCIIDEAIAAQVTEDNATATKFGGSGTPFSIIVNNETKSGTPVTGAVPYEQWLSLLQASK